MYPARIMTAAALGGAALLLAACGGTTAAGPNPGGGDATGATGATGAAVAQTVAKDGRSAALLPARYRQNGINVASDIPFAPMEMLDANQNVTGFDYDLSQALGAKLGVKVSFQEQAWDSIIPSLQSGKHDIIMAGMNDTTEREKTLDFVDYFHGGMAILVKKGNPNGIRTLLDLCGRTVSVEKSTVQGDLLKAAAPKCVAAGKQPINVSELPTEGDAELAIRSGKADADVLDAAVAEYNAKTAGDGAIFQTVHDPANPNGYSPVHSGIAVLKKDHDLTVALQSALQSLITDGTYTKLLARYDLQAYGVRSAMLNQGT